MDINEDYTLTFRDVLENIKKILSKEILDNISDETCFVCLLHLANEKSNLFSLYTYLISFRS